ncbi:MAG: hypothetical protein GY913_28390 [Proteobacteria bacterium]|nr:hypothetical protein [Pseudomonadota bacterium]MCP4920832.1 hypothetical protein [Pseudomonadota bacterium]
MFLLLLSTVQAQDEIVFEPYGADAYTNAFTIDPTTGLAQLDHGNLNQVLNGSDPATEEAWLGREDVVFFDIDAEPVFSDRCHTDRSKTGCADVSASNSTDSSLPYFDGDDRYAANAYAVLTHAIDTYFHEYSNVDFSAVDYEAHGLTVWIGTDSGNGNTGPGPCGGSCMRPNPGNQHALMVGALPGGSVADDTTAGLYWNRPYIQLSNDYMDGSGKPRKLAHTMVHEYGHYYNRVIAYEYTDGGVEYEDRSMDTRALGEALGYWWSSDWEGEEFLSRFNDMDANPTWAEYGRMNQDHHWGEVLTDAMWETREICAASSDRVDTNPMSYAVFDLVDNTELDAFGPYDPFTGTPSNVRGFAYALYVELESIGFCTGDELVEVADLYRQRGLFPHTIQETAGNASQTDDAFGSVLATGDFNGDGELDLVAAAPDNSNRRGAAWVFYGPRALDWASTDTLTQSDASATVEDGDRFGEALAVGDFNGDGFDDLAVGSPGEDGGSTDDGVVHVFFGGTSPLAKSVELDQKVLGSSRENGDFFGFALAAGDFDGNGIDDLAIGSPGEDLGSAIEAGYIHVVSGTSKGLDTGKPMGMSQASLGATSQSSDNLGYSLIAGDFDADRYDDLAMGAPGKAVASEKGGDGTVFVMHGDDGGLDKNQLQQLDQGDFSTPVEAGDGFGTTLATGDFDGDRYDDLAIGAPFEDSPSADDVGQVHVAYGTSGSLSPDSAFTQTSAGQDHADEDHFAAGLHAGDLDGDGLDELLVGAPGRYFAYTELDATGTEVILRDWDGAGNVHVFWGQAVALPGNSTSVTAHDLGTAFSATAAFGAAVSSGDLDGDGQDELVLGVPGHPVDGDAAAGQFVTGRVEP